MQPKPRPKAATNWWGKSQMTRWHNHYPDNHAFFCTASVADWRPVLTDPNVAVIYEEWNKAREALSVRILAFCVMPDHIHVLLWTVLGQSVRDFLHRTLAQTSRRLQPGGGFWKERPRVLPVFSRPVLRAKIDYLHRNPVASELVENPEDWRHSSFRQLEIGEADPPFRCDAWTDIWV